MISAPDLAMPTGSAYEVAVGVYIGRYGTRYVSEPGWGGPKFPDSTQFRPKS